MDVTEGVILVVLAGTQRRHVLATPAYIAVAALVGNTGQQVVGAGTELHRIGQAQFGARVQRRQHPVLFIDAAGGQAETGVDVHPVFAVVVNAEKSVDLDVTHTAGAGRECTEFGGTRRALKGHVFHRLVEIGQHAHHGDLIGGRVHDAQHVHVRGHFGRHHAQRRWLHRHTEENVGHRGHDFLR